MTARYPTKRATSAGGLVYADRPDGRWVVLIAHRDTAGRLQWTLPKGGLEDGEDFEKAAVREVQEETGLEAEITGKLGVVDYWFVWKPDHVRYHKFVHYFLMVHRGGDLRYRDDEAEEVTWLPIKQAVTRLSHANERRLILDAHPELCPGPQQELGRKASMLSTHRGPHPEGRCTDPDLPEDAKGQAEERPT